MSSANANQLSDTEELISRTRGLTVRQLHVNGKDHFSDRGIAIKKIQALIATNEDILQRCNELTSTRHSKLYQITSFCKSDFNVVKVWNMAGMTQIVAFKEVVTQTFNMRPLLCLPEGLNMFEPKRERSGLIDFRSLLRTSLMLHDDILLPFLWKLQDHLELAQVSLGSLDAWVMNSHDNVLFLQSLFGIDIDSVSMTTSQSTWCRCGDHQNYDICHNCGREYLYHSPNSDSSRQCPATSVSSATCVRRARQKMLSGIVDPTTFCCKKHFRVLAEYNLQEKYEASFNIDQKSEREQLKILCEFLENRYKSSIYSVLNRDNN